MVSRDRHSTALNNLAQLTQNTNPLGGAPAVCTARD
jgi:hypothetical protein